MKFKIPHWQNKLIEAISSFEATENKNFCIVCIHVFQNQCKHFMYLLYKAILNTQNDKCVNIIKGQTEYQQSYKIAFVLDMFMYNAKISDFLV